MLALRRLKPVHVQNRCEGNLRGGENLALIGAAYTKGTIWCKVRLACCGRHACITTGHDRRRIRGAALQRSAEQDLKNYWHRRSEKVSEKEVKINLNVNKDDDAANVEQSVDAQAVGADTAKADAEVAKLGARPGRIAPDVASAAS